MFCIFRWESEGLICNENLGHTVGSCLYTKTFSMHHYKSDNDMDLQWSLNCLPVCLSAPACVYYMSCFFSECCIFLYPEKDSVICYQKFGLSLIKPFTWLKTCVAFIIPKEVALYEIRLPWTILLSQPCRCSPGYRQHGTFHTPSYLRAGWGRQDSSWNLLHAASVLFVIVTWAAVFPPTIASWWA